MFYVTKTYLLLFYSYLIYLLCETVGLKYIKYLHIRIILIIFATYKKMET